MASKLKFHYQIEQITHHGASINERLRDPNPNQIPDSLINHS